jgi:CHASE2 domain-containing sensor protein
LDVVREAAPQLVIIDANIPPERTVDPDADARLASVLREGPFAIWSGATPEQQGEPYGSVTIASDELFRRAVRMELPMTLFAEGGDVIYIGDPSVGVSAPLESQVWMARPLREIAGRAINRPGRFDLINFYGPPGTIPRISLSALLQEDQRAHLQETVRGKIVIVGYQSLHYGRSHLSKDEVPVPVSNRGMFGVEVHATVAANLLDGSWLRRFDLVNELLFVILVVLILGSIVVRSPRPRTLVGALIAYVVMVCAGYLLFSKYNVWLAGLPTIGVSIGMMFVVSSCYFLVRSESYRRYIDATFSFKREKEF